ncbi:hypothetical protein A3K82_02155 [Candidatus Pacearchaeota archaeon RBG_19FT_COMBO_34_9]|nr:MAG: hypothetical protein A3K82_02155 [Candidatus Pacearchaeota archaeon RBG_19FT_COMBO_34_9]OGJ16087.1 MAG: hypothetical protein A3K74_02535 [Candidatus Pacearchaeota archaeon RBG_13_33_26]
MTPIEIIVLILISFSVIKILTIPNIWMKYVIRPLYSKPKILFLVELILAGIVLFFLLQSLTIVQILAVVAFGALLTGMTFAWYGKETISWAEKLLKKGIWKKAWLPILIWLALIVWGALVLFGVI